MKLFFARHLVYIKAKKNATTKGLEPSIFRSRTPYPLGHAANHMMAEIFNALLPGGNQERNVVNMHVLIDPSPKWWPKTQISQN